MCNHKCKFILLHCEVCNKEHLHKVYKIEDVELCGKCFRIYLNGRNLFL